MRRKIFDMTAAPLIFRRTIDLPPVIVWDAFVDPELLAGWLGQVRIIPTKPTTFRLLLPDTDVDTGSARRGSGTVTELEVPRRIRVETDHFGRIDCTLASVPGGLRGSSTALELRVDIGIEPAFASGAKAQWEVILDRLEALLRGHPVNWRTASERTAGSPGAPSLTCAPGFACAPGPGGTAGRFTHSSH